MKDKNIYAVIPAFNESQKIARVVTDLKKSGLNVVVVDDGSNDDTFDSARRAGANTYRHIINLGQGAALQTGIEIALKMGAEYIVTYDADDQHDPRDIAPLLSRITKGDYDVILGSRFLKKISIELLRQLQIPYQTHHYTCK